MTALSTGGYQSFTHWYLLVNSDRASEAVGALGGGISVYIFCQEKKFEQQGQQEPETTGHIVPVARKLRGIRSGAKL